MIPSAVMSLSSAAGAAMSSRCCGPPARAFAGYNDVYADGRVREAGCIAHARRKIHDLHARRATATTTEALRRIGELYAIEGQIRGQPPDRCREIRQQQARPLLDSLELWLRERLLTLSTQSDTTKAINYMLNQWQALVYYCEDALAEIDNNIAENALRGCCLGRKNFLFMGLIVAASGLPPCMHLSAAPGSTALIRRPIYATSCPILSPADVNWYTQRLKIDTPKLGR
jgi:hypothetical protein